MGRRLQKENCILKYSIRNCVGEETGGMDEVKNKMETFF